MLHTPVCSVVKKQKTKNNKRLVLKVCQMMKDSLIKSLLILNTEENVNYSCGSNKWNKKALCWLHIPSDFLLERSRIGRVELDSQTHGERRLSYNRKHQGGGGTLWFHQNRSNRKQQNQDEFTLLPDLWHQDNRAAAYIKVSNVWRSLWLSF